MSEPVTVYRERIETPEEDSRFPGFYPDRFNLSFSRPGWKAPKQSKLGQAQLVQKLKAQYGEENVKLGWMPERVRI